MKRPTRSRTNVVPFVPKPLFERARAALCAAVVSKGLYMTLVREKILLAVLGCEGPFDVPALAERCALPRSTVYRNIPLLVAAQLVRPVLAQGECKLYEVMFERPSHGHLICEACGRVVKIRPGPLEALRRDIAGLHGFEVDTYVHDVRGVCADCGAKRRR